MFQNIKYFPNFYFNFHLLWQLLQQCNVNGASCKGLTVELNPGGSLIHVWYKQAQVQHSSFILAFLVTPEDKMSR